jgi:hypothetical protein
VAKLPEPPPAGALARVPPTEKVLPAGSLLWRLYFRSGSHPALWRDFRHFGPLGGRFDHLLSDAAGKPRLQRRGIYFAALDLITCLAEVFQSTRVIDRNAEEPSLLDGRQPSGREPLRARGGCLAEKAGPPPPFE